MQDRQPGRELAVWMVERNLSVKEACALFDCHRNCLSRIRNGHGSPSLKLANKIQALTEGRVSASAWGE